MATEPEQMTPEQAERYVRERWKHVSISSAHQYQKRSEPLYSVIDLGDGGLVSGHATQEECVIAAAEYTRQHEQKIDQCKRAKKLMAVFQTAISQHDPQWEDLQFIYSLVESQLAELLRGWRQQ